MTKMDFLQKLDAETLKAELLEYLSADDDNLQMKVEFEELFVDYIKDDFSRSNG